jgi:uncharacterized protein (DUF58 family)
MGETPMPLENDMAKPRKHFRRRYDYRSTLAGMFFLAGMALLALAAVNNQRAMLLVLFGLMVGAFCSGILVARYMLSCLEVRRNLPDRCFAGGVAHLAYSLRHRRPRGMGVVGIEISEVDPPPRLRGVEGYCLYLPAGRSFSCGARISVSRRGLLPLTGLRLLTRFPFRLVQASRMIRQQAQLIVWPALGRLKVNLLTGGSSQISDAAPSQVHSGSDEFFGLREYRQGDNPRWIHWKRSAGRRMPVVREMSKPRPDTLLVVLDAQLPPGAAPDALEGLISFAATLIDSAIHREFQVGLALGDAGGMKLYPPRGGRGQRTALLDALALAQVGNRPGLGEALQAAARGDPSSMHLVVATAQPGLLDTLAVARRLCPRLTLATPENLPELFESAPAGAAAPADIPPAARKNRRFGREVA